MSGTVVLGVIDGSVRMPVADAAAGFALRGGRPLRVVHVHTGPHTVWEGDAGVRTEAYLVRTAPDVTVERLCTVGDPVEVLLETAGTGGILVLGDRRLRLGSDAGRTTLEVLARAAGAVMVVPEYRIPAGGSARRGGVVAGLDGSATDEAVLTLAAEAAGAGRTPLEILDGAVERRECVGALLAHVPTAPTVVAIVPTPDPLDKALALDARGADLAVVGLPSTGREDSLAGRLLTGAPCPVLVVTGEPPGVVRPGAGRPTTAHQGPKDPGARPPAAATLGS